MTAEQVYARTEPHRRACEAREVLRWPLPARRIYLADVRRLRGDAAADALQDEITRQWRASRPTAIKK
ncbi:hypothetical protein [Thiomonas sp.]|jgi:hypothetical protein|uniref:DUF7696 family protein n=1 Tax=Thiomonas sp. TaxID=2047785 RepID=UPI00258D88E8|nr:hypothetical protein [Thiomonas sp.]